MGQVLHGSATTTTAIRRAIQHSQESLRVLARRHGINPKTVAKWRKRDTVTDLPIGPTHPKSTVLTIEEEAIVTGFRRHTPLAGRCRVRLGSAGPSDLPSMPRSPDDRGIFSRASSRRNEKPR